MKSYGPCEWLCVYNREESLLKGDWLLGRNDSGWPVDCGPINFPTPHGTYTKIPEAHTNVKRTPRSFGHYEHSHCICKFGVMSYLYSNGFCVSHNSPGEGEFFVDTVGAYLLNTHLP